MAVSLSETAISLPFSIDTSGKVAPATTQEKIWDDRVLSVLGTCVRERLLNPLFGTRIPFAIFETADDAINEVKQEIALAFNTFLPRLTLISSQVTFNYTTGSIDSLVVFQLPNNNTSTVSTSVVVGTLALSGANPSYEV
jgi:phage baseplate assembly protein W